MLSSIKIISPSEEKVYIGNHINDFNPTFKPDDIHLFIILKTDILDIKQMNFKFRLYSLFCE